MAGRFCRNTEPCKRLSTFIMQNQNDLSAQCTTSSHVTGNALIQIISDSIIMDRICPSLNQVINANNPNENLEEFELEHKLHGIGTAWVILNIDDDEKLIDILGQYYLDQLFKSGEDAGVLANRIYRQWLELIKDYYTKK